MLNTLVGRRPYKNLKLVFFGTGDVNQLGVFFSHNKPRCYRKVLTRIHIISNQTNKHTMFLQTTQNILKVYRLPIHATSHLQSTYIYSLGYVIKYICLLHMTKNMLIFLLRRGTLCQCL